MLPSQAARCDVMNVIAATMLPTVNRGNQKPQAPNPIPNTHSQTQTQTQPNWSAANWRAIFSFVLDPTKLRSIPQVLWVEIVMEIERKKQKRRRATRWGDDSEIETDKAMANGKCNLSANFICKLLLHILALPFSCLAGRRAECPPPPHVIFMPHAAPNQ